MLLKGRAIALGVLFATGVAHAEPPRICFDAPLSGQSLRDAGKLHDARAAFVACAAETCPAIIQRDCARWLAEIDERMPTLVVTASDAQGHDLIDVRVLVDGVLLKPRIDGIAVTVDPGVHAFRFERDGLAPVERRIVVRDDEKFQKLHVDLESTPLAPPPPAPPRPPPPAPRKEDAGFPTAALVSASIGVVALGAFGYFAATGSSDVHHLTDTCAPSCNPSDADSARHELRNADIALGVGIVALGVATWLYFDWRGSHSSRARDIARVDAFRF